MKRLSLPFSALLSCCLLVSCAGVFVNPDLAGGKTPPASLGFRVPLPNIDPNEELLYRGFKDTGVGRIAEHDFYRIQEIYLNLAARAVNPAHPFLFFADTMGSKDITRLYNYDSPVINPLRFLESVAGQGFSVYGLKKGNALLLCAYLRSGLPVLGYGTVIVKKQYQKTKQEYNADTVFKSSPELQGDVNSQVFRKLVSFELLTGYAKLNGPSQKLPYESSDEYLFETRSRLNFKAKPEKPMLNTAFSLYGGMPLGSTWVFSEFYVLTPKDMSAEVLADKVKAVAVQAGLTGDVPLPEKLF